MLGCGGFKSSFKEFFMKNNSVATRQQNLQYLEIRIYKVKMGLLR